MAEPLTDQDHAHIHSAIHGHTRTSPGEWERIARTLHAELERLQNEQTAAQTFGELHPSSKAQSDTLPAWLAQRFDPRGPDWDALSDDDRAYWEHHARAVRRAVTRNGFKEA